MSEAEPRHLLTAWSRLFVGSLSRSGVREVVISPGSRSTPLVCALLAEPGLRLWSALDERAAAFFALGLGRATGRPPLLVCTSGTAAAHYYPAVIEAFSSQLPLLIASADRPTELVDCAAPQTIEQAELFGRFVRGFSELGQPDAHPAALLGLRRKVSQGVALARGPRPGPVHFNFRARKPLEPSPAETDTERALAALVDQLLADVPAVWTADNTPSPAGLEALAHALAAAERPLLVLGAAPPALAELVDQLATQLGAPFLAETAAHAPGALPAQQVVRSFARSLPAPDLVLRFGAPLTAGALEPYLDSLAAPEYLVTEHGFPDPRGRARGAVQGDLIAAARGLLARCASPRTPSEFSQAWREAGALARARVARALGPEASWCEPVAVATALASVPEGAQAVLGNSMPIRIADAVRTELWRDRSPPRIFVQRGANGIDGTLAGAAGAAHGAEKPTLALLGDVTAAHDLSSLALCRSSPVPLLLVVLDNDGGHIFDQLPVAQHPEVWGTEQRFWSTPPGIDFAAAARTYGVSYESAEDRGTLQGMLDAAWRRPGATLLHLRLDAAAAWRWFAGLEVEIGVEP